MKHTNTQTSKYFALLILMFFALFKIQAQQTAMQLANTELRHLFQHLTNPNPNVHFFYDLSAHYVDSLYFNNYVTDTNNVENWYGLYQEMYFMAYDTSLYINADSVFNLVYARFQSDTIPIGVMDWDFNLLKPGALNSNIYFDFDTLNEVLFDKAGAPNPYTIQTTFSGAALRKTYPFTNPVFEINPNWIFKDASKDYTHSETEFKIDFGDGSGWQVFNDIQVQHYQAQYAGKGVKLLKYAIFEMGILTQYSVSAIYISSDKTLTSPNEIWYVPGLTVGVYSPDLSCNVNTEKKYVIYLSGFDPLDNYNIPEIYQDKLVDNNITQLKNFGYTFLVVDWKNSHRDIQKNANYVIQLIEYLKCLPNTGTDIVEHKPPFVMIAHSMGGLVARYALTTMEQPNYFSSCYTKGVAHNTRLLLAADTPHQGANIPMAYQYLYRYASVATVLSISPYATAMLAKYFLLLNGSASQMLTYHIDSDLYWLLPISTSPVGEHTNKTKFDTELATLGNYPKSCKLAAISNGSWLGTHQNRSWDSSPRMPNDKFLDLNAELRLRILGIRIVGAKYEMVLRSNPLGTGEVFKARAGITHWKIDLFWFGAKLKWHTSYVAHIQKAISNSQPLCVMPGSYMINSGQVSKPSSFNNFNALSLFEFSATQGNGNLQVHAFLGPQFLGTGLNFDLNAYTDGFGFTFIPTASAFDYQKQGAPLDHPILSNPVDVGDIMSRTPFDVVFTNPTEINRHHPYVSGNEKLEICETCLTLPNGDPIYSYPINREIGDDTLWVENLNANYEKPIEAERAIFINHRNIYYNYDGVIGQDRFNIELFPNNYDTFEGAIILSKKRSVQFTYPGQLRSNNTLFVNGSQPPIGSYSWQQGAMSICCINYDYKKESQKNTLRQTKTGSLYLYPNPTANQLTITYQMQSNTKVTITVTDLLGRQIAVWIPSFIDHTQKCYYAVNANDLNWPTGMYLITVSNGTETYRSPLMINK